MVLVGYSDSEASESEEEKLALTTHTTKRLDRGDGNKIKVNLPSLKPEVKVDAEAEPAAKRQRTGGTFSGFNSLLPAPKRAAQQSIKPGISLRTSSEAAFSRTPAPRLHPDAQAEVVEQHDAGLPAVDSDTISNAVEEPKIVGKATRFLPLSVANAKKKKRPPLPPTTESKESSRSLPTTRTEAAGKASVEVQPKAKVPLFPVVGPNSTRLSASAEPYEPEFVRSSNAGQSQSIDAEVAIPQSIMPLATALGGVANDLNLSASERRRLFGRQGGQGDVKIAHFNMDAEYKFNQDLAAKGETVEHREVRAIAPGKHSLQQLVNNVKGQTEAIEDKWAAGRRARGEAGSKYGW